MAVAAVILAAGASSRMGQAKQLLRFEGTSLLQRAVDSALGAGCAPVVVVTGANAPLVVGELRRLDVITAHNTDWESGVGSSIRAGVERALVADGDLSAVVLLLCDQPHVTADVITRLLRAAEQSGAAIVASSYGDSYGVPALFARELFGELRHLDGSGGAKQLITKYREAAQLVDFRDGVVDIDTPEDFERLLASRE